MAQQKPGNAVIGQSGGPTAVINQSLVGVVEELRQSGHVNRLLGAKHGVRGIVSEQFIELNDVPDELLARVANTPAAALGSTRDKPDRDYCERIFRSFAKNDVRYFFYIGGNDSADTARIVSELAKAEGYPLQTFHIPKTIDNDLRVHDHTPGYGSAARWVASAIRGDNFDNKSLPGIKVDIIMGRNAGFLTAASVLARHRDDDGPHLIYLPEAPVSEDKFLGDVDAMYKKHGRCLIAVSEGITAPDGKTWFEKRAETHERDSHGNLQLSGSGELGDYLADLIKSRLGAKLRVRADTFGYVQRSFPMQSETDAKEARLVTAKTKVPMGQLRCAACPAARMRLKRSSRRSRPSRRKRSTWTRASSRTATTSRRHSSTTSRHWWGSCRRWGHLTRCVEGFVRRGLERTSAHAFE